MSGHELFAETLPLYALGALEQAEAARMEAHLSTCLECREELLRLRGDMAMLALSTPAVEAPPRSRARLLAAMRREASETRVASPLRWWPALATVGVMLLAALTAGLWMTNQSLRKELAGVRARAAADQQRLAEAGVLADLLRDPSSVHLVLAPVESRPQPQIKTVFSPSDRRVVLIASNLQTPPPGHVYELWLLPATGESPVPAGLFHPDERGAVTVLLPALPAGIEPAGFAVTLEPERGSATPTLPILFVGSIS